MVGQTNVSATAAATATTNGTTQALVAADAGAASTRFHTVDTWLGFTPLIPNFIDTSLLGNVRITITLASGDILGGGAAGAANNNRTYTVSSQAFSIDTVSISDGIYDSMVDSMLASGRPIEIPFKKLLRVHKFKCQYGANNTVQCRVAIHR
jgi:hypothetical protein